MGMMNRNFYLVELLCGFIFNRTIQISPFTIVFLAFSWPVEIITSGLWQASYRSTYQRRSYVVAVSTEILRSGGLEFSLARQASMG